MLVPGPNGSKMEPLSVRRVSEIMAMEFSDSDFILKNGYLTKGESLAICGAGGIGKSRLILQMLIDIITGRKFLGWQTNGKGTRWLLLQSENTCRRLKGDLAAMCSTLSEEEKQLVEDCLVIHTLEKGDDSFLHLDVAENQERVDALVETHPSDGIVFDVLRDFSVDDLDRDSGMQDTLAVISRLTRKRNPHCIPIIMQHARTGKSGAASATGFDRSSFGRNSKVLFGWTRAQINVAAYGPDNNDVLIVASAKCNNAPEFAMFAVRRNEVTMSYERDDSVDIEAWREYVSGNGKEPKREWMAEDVLGLMPEKPDVTIPKNDLIAKATCIDMPVRKIRPFIAVLIYEKKVKEHKSKRSARRDEVLLSRTKEGVRGPLG